MHDDSGSALGESHRRIRPHVFLLFRYPEAPALRGIMRVSALIVTMAAGILADRLIFPCHHFCKSRSAPQTCPSLLGFCWLCGLDGTSFSSALQLPVSGLSQIEGPSTWFVFKVLPPERCVSAQITPSLHMVKHKIQ